MQLGRRSRYIYVYAVCTWCVVGSIQPIGHFVIVDCFCPFFFLEIPFWLRTYSESPQGQSPPSCSGHTDWNDFSYEELDFFSTVLLRMMKKDMEQKVKEHDYYRISLVQEYENRQELEFNDSDSEILREMTETFV